MLLLILKSIKIIRAHRTATYRQSINDWTIERQCSCFLVSKYKIVSKFMRTYEAEMATATQTKEDIALRVIDVCGLVQSSKTIELLKKIKKSAQQRVTDFIELEKTELFLKRPFKITITSF
jgi:hypothetical protein